MSRSERLFDLLHALRRRRQPVSGKTLAEESLAQHSTQDQSQAGLRLLLMVLSPEKSG